MAKGKTRATPEEPKVYLYLNGHQFDISNAQLTIDDGEPGVQSRVASSLVADYLKYQSCVRR